MKVKYSFCESVHATPYSKWHIRRLTKLGRKLGGGADTLALCGRVIGWDLDVKLDFHHLAHNSCPSCVEEYEKVKEEQDV